jgi:hypothetical protein
LTRFNKGQGTNDRGQRRKGRPVVPVVTIRAISENKKSSAGAFSMKMQPEVKDSEEREDAGFGSRSSEPKKHPGGKHPIPHGHL